MPLDVELRGPKAILFVAIQATDIAIFELSGVWIVVARFALSRRRGVSAYAGVRCDRMTRGAVNGLVRVAQKIDLRVLGTVKPCWGETALLVAVKTTRIFLVELAGVGIVMAPGAGVDPPRIVGRIRVVVTLRIGQIAGMTLLAGDVRMRSFQGKTCQGVNLRV